MVVLQPVTFRDKKEYNLHRILRAIDLNTLGSKLTPSDYCAPGEVMAAQDEVAAKYSRYPKILSNTQELINACDFQYQFGVPRNRKHYTAKRETDLELHQLSTSGARMAL